MEYYKNIYTMGFYTLGYSPILSNNVRPLYDMGIDIRFYYGCTDASLSRGIMAYKYKPQCKH